METSILDARDLYKRFGDLVAVDGVSVQISAGEALGLLGPNGAGKTTTVSMIVDIQSADRGEVFIGGRPLKSDNDPAKRRLGLVPQDLALYEELTAYQNLRFFGALYGLHGALLARAIVDALELVSLAERAKDKVNNFSGGMKRRLNLAAALLHNPDVLLLDEPTVGVDPQSRHAIFDNLETLKKQGKALLYTTHYMEEAERLCDRIVIIDHGKVIAEDTLRGLYHRLPARNRLVIELQKRGNETGFEALRTLPGIDAVAARDGMLLVDLNDLSLGASQALLWLSQNGHAINHVVSERADLEAVFLSLTGRSLRDL